MRIYTVVYGDDSPEFYPRVDEAVYYSDYLDARTEANQLNEKIIADQQASIDEYNQREETIVREHNALVFAGMRSGLKSFIPRVMDDETGADWKVLTIETR